MRFEGGLAFRTTGKAFLRANADLERSERRTVCGLAKGKHVVFGGGATPLIWIRRVK